MKIAFLIISFLLDGIISVNLHQGTMFLPLFSLLSIVLIYPTFRTQQHNIYLLVAASVGFLYDIIYVHSLFLNTVIFIGLALITMKIYSVLPVNILNTYVVSLAVIVLYRVIIFLFLALIQAISFDVVGLLNSIISSLIINFIYITVGYLLIKKINGKNNPTITKKR